MPEVLHLVGKVEGVKRVEGEGMPVERRQSPRWLPIFAVVLAALSFVFGPCFGAGVAVLGNYVTASNHSVIADAQQKQLAEDMKSIRESLTKLVDQNTVRVGTDATTTGNIQHLTDDLNKEIDERKRLTDKLESEIVKNNDLINAYGNRRK
jgi:hypothetical protein